ncbi:response regulator [Sphingopyxis sp.]|uniref:response regulator n=1 Tax=Sphingopyxis sp. TaxID=1908224 RepID=UPI003BA8A2BD
MDMPPPPLSALLPDLFELVPRERFIPACPSDRQDGNEAKGGGGARLDQKTRVLIIDDDAAIRSLTAEFLGTHGIDVATGTGAADLYAHLKSSHFDAIVLDVMMAGEDGLTALGKLPIHDRPPVILVSVLGNDIDRMSVSNSAPTIISPSRSIRENCWHASADSCAAARSAIRSPTASSFGRSRAGNSMHHNGF